jgi:adenine specific DNA methylase Mod
MSQSEGKTGTAQPKQKTNATLSQEKAASPLEKFQDLIRQLFQIEAADLDFGIYRILNYKRKEVENFINERLPQIVNKAFQDYAKAEKENLQREIERKREEISQAFGEKAFDQQGQLQPEFRETPLGKKYLALQEEMAQYQVTEDLKNRVYNDLYTFFSRYYEDGDFIPKRRYGRRATYTIPYNGEEVVLHWVTKDQYYIKTGERFKNYRFKVKISTKDKDSPQVQDYTIAFELRSAKTEQNNNKGEKRYFVLVSDNPVVLNQKTKTITVFFEYRPLTDAEQKEFGKTKQQQKLQDNLNEKAADAILKQLQDLAAKEPKNSEEQKELEALKAQLEKPEAENGKSLLIKHLDRFTRRNTSDFFIHKNLRRFLQEQLDFFIKTECLLLEELLEQKGNLTHQDILRARAVRDVGHQIIEFLAQVEDFQKRLFEKKKFVIRTEYCITMDRVPEELWDEVLQNKRQLAEWRQLYGVNPQPTKEFLREHPYLVVDTCHFPGDFKWRLLMHLDDLTKCCLTIDRIPISRVPKALWAEVFQNKTQLDEWRQLYGVDPQPTKEFLREHPTLFVNTHHFSEDFKRRLREYLDGLTEHCLPIGRVPEELWDEVLQNERQLTEWRQLYGVDPQPTKEFLREHPTLFVNTHHFSEDFKERLREYFEGLTEYCLPIGRVPEELWDEVLQNEAQLAEWRQLHGVDPQPTKEFLRKHPKLVVATRHFSKDFKERLMKHLDGSDKGFDLDEALDGLLIKSENFQALNLLMERYRGQVQCIYIDPPYNTGNDEFIYRDEYRHSSWLTMMDNRLALAKTFLNRFGAIFVSVDDNEQAHLRLLMDELYGQNNLITTMVWEGGLKNDSRFTSVSQDYIVSYVLDLEQLASADRKWRTRKEGIDYIYREVEKLKKRHGSDWAAISSDLKKWYRHLPKGHPALAHKHYSWVDEKGVFFPADISAESGRTREPYDVLHPITGKPCKRPLRGWPTKETMEKHIRDGRVLWGPDHTTVPKLKRYLHETEGQVLPAVFYRDRRAAFKELRNILGDDGFANPKDPYILGKLIEASADNNVWILDFFAGSGTTAHAVINLNREDGGRRKYILVEMGDYFETVLLPRIKKVVYSDNWKNGKPQKGKGISHFFKYLYLEQYEDTLNNLELTRKEDGQLALERFGDEYLLRYMLDFETQGSPSLLNLEQFQDPFNYKLKVQEGDEIRECVVDLVETFNYLLGIHVKKMRQFQDNGRLYRAVLGEKHGKRIVIVWRPLKGLLSDSTDVQRAQGSNGEPGDAQRDKDSQGDTPALRRDRKFIECTVLPALLGKGKKPDRLLVNGICYVPGAEPIEPEFKRLMWRENQNGWEV